MIFSYIIGIGILILVLKILLLPFKIIIKFVINSVVAGIILTILGIVGISIALTWWSILLIGLLGIPGLVILLILKMFI